MGGTHGDFLYTCCNFMIENQSFNLKDKIANNGRVLESSIFKKINDNLYRKGVKKGLMLNDLNTYKEVEICHIWYEEFINWPSKFYYIDYNSSLIDIIQKMYLEKVFNNDIDKAIERIQRYLPTSLARKINHKNINQIIRITYKNLKKKIKKQPNVKLINIVDLYSLDKLIDILKDMEIYNEKKMVSLEIFHKDWIEKNNKWINIIKNR